MDNTAIIGHQHICRFLENALEKHKESHAYLFLGQSLVGKGTVARWFSSRISGQAPAGQNLIWLDPEKGIKISDIRKLRSGLSLTNPFGGFRVAVLRRAEEMTPEAQNAFLKILEEPKTAVVFILTAETIQGLLPTIISRVQIIRFTPVPTKVISAALQSRGIPAPAAHKAAQLSLGCPGKARLLCQGENLPQAEERPREIINLFSLLPHQRFKLVYSILESGRIDTFLDTAEGVWRDLWLWQKGNRLGLVNLGLQSEIAALSSQVSSEQIALGLHEIRHWRYLRDRNVNKKLSLERLMLKSFPSKINQNK